MSAGRLGRLVAAGVNDRPKGMLVVASRPEVLKQDVEVRRDVTLLETAASEGDGEGSFEVDQVG